jgi:hypothetical protein
MGAVIAASVVQTVVATAWSAKHLQVEIPQAMLQRRNYG